MTSARQQIREIRRAGYLPGETAGCHCSDCEKSCGKGWWKQTNYEYDEWECYCRSCAYRSMDTGYTELKRQSVRESDAVQTDIDNPTDTEGGA